MVPISKRPTARPTPLAGGALQIDLDPASPLPLFRQIYDGIRRAILDGRLRPGQRLPATRAMADELGVSRNTALSAFDQLLSEGYLESRTGSGTFVTEHLPEQMLQAEPAAGRAARGSGKGRQLSSYGAMVAGAHGGGGTQELIPFQSRGPALDAFPFDLWERIATRHIRGLSRRFFSYSDPAGYLPLREAIAEYLRSARAVRCTPERVIIVAGAQQGIDLAARVLLDPGDRVLVEDPGYLGTRGALRAAGAEAVPVPVDAEGIRIDIGKMRGPDARMVCVTPSHSYPLGVVMSLARRLELLEWAAEAGAWIVEDDYDSEYRYGGRPISSLQGLDTSDRVIYVGTFSKVLFPGLRLGYIVVPEDLVAAMTAARAAADRHGPTLESAITATFIEEGHFARHIRRMRVLYKKRQAFLVECAERELAGLLDVSPSAAGMHLIGWLPEGMDDRAAATRAEAAGVLVHPLSAYSIRERLRPGLILGYTHFDERATRRGIRALAKALREELEK